MLRPYALPVGIEHVLEPHPAAIEVQVHEAGRTIAVLRHNQLRGPLHAAAGPVHLLPEHGKYHIGVLFWRAEHTVVVERRPLIVTLGVEAGQLRDYEERHLARERQRLEMP